MFNSNVPLMGNNTAVSGESLGMEGDLGGHDGQDVWALVAQEVIALEEQRNLERKERYVERVNRWFKVCSDRMLVESTLLFWEVFQSIWPRHCQRTFNSKFGTSPEVFGRMWLRYGLDFEEWDVYPSDILMTFNWLTTNSTFDDLAANWHAARSTFHEVAWRTLYALYEILDEISWDRLDWHNLEEPIPNEAHMLKGVTFIVDGIECGIAKPVDPIEEHAWYSNKKGGHSIKYEVVTSISSGRIKWISGGISGALHDVTLSRNSGLLDAIPPGELGIADRAVGFRLN